MAEAASRLAVLGSPIGHSKSPAIHAAAYATLGLPWEYGRHEVPEGGLRAFLDGRGDGWRGLSVTMPLKREAARAALTRSTAAELTGAVNTLVFPDGSASAEPSGWNTDVAGLVAALRRREIGAVGSVTLLGAGGTASAVVAALPAVGAAELTLVVRSPERAGQVVDLAERLAIRVRVLDAEGFDAQADSAKRTGLLVNTVPGDRQAVEIGESWAADTPLFDVIYDPWPTGLARSWQSAGGGAVLSGLELLLEQALIQVRLFAGLGEDEQLPDEGAVLAAMRAAAQRVPE